MLIEKNNGFGDINSEKNSQSLYKNQSLLGKHHFKFNTFKSTWTGGGDGIHLPPSTDFTLC